MKRFTDTSVGRTHSVFFAGKASTHQVRQVVWDNLERYRELVRHDPAIPAPFENILFRMGHMDEKAYIDALSDSDLCLAPRGTRVQGPRLIEMMLFGCIPVIIADNYKLPASCMFYWSRMAIVVPEATVTNLGRILMD